ncbi:MAG: glycosyltransferase 87 family protein, partial [Bdellovibrionota bacterium]
PGGHSQTIYAALLARDRLIQGMDPYIPNEILPYKYSPFAALPYYLLPTDHAMAWFYFKLVSILALIKTLAFGYREATWRRVLLTFVGIALAWKGFAQTIFYGQLEFIILAMAVGATWLFPFSPLLAGILIGILPWLKIPLGFLVFPFLILLWTDYSRTRNTRPGIAFFGGLGLASVFCGVIFPALAFGLDRTLELTRSWLVLIKTQPPELFEEAINQSIWMAMVRWFGPAVGGSFVMKAIVLALILGAMALLVRRHMRNWSVRENPLVWISPWILLNQIINPLGWVWGGLFVLGVPLALEKPLPRKRWLFVLTLILIAATWLVQQRPFPQMMGFATWEDLFPLASITVFWVAVLALAL